MKKGIIALAVLCTGLLLLDPIKSISFANKNDNIENTNIVEYVDKNEVNYIEDKEDCKVLTKEEAEDLLKNINPDLEYIYQGDENTFPVLKEKNLTGYVFLPYVDTDMGYFVDKTNSDIYFFHPSGYLELVK